MTQAQICAAAGLPVHPSGTGCGSAPKPDPTPTVSLTSDSGTGDGRGHDDDPGNPNDGDNDEGVVCPTGYQRGSAITIVGGESITATTRATDIAGNTQPDRVPFNQKGYLFNQPLPHPIRVTA